MSDKTLVVLGRGMIAIALISSTLLTGCADRIFDPALTGVPQGLSADQRDKMSANDLGAQITVANTLLSTYQDARNQNLKYAFNSNFWVLTLAGAAGAAGAFRAGRDTLAGIGVGAGILLAGDSFLNARPNAKVYQSGMNALTCEVVNLKPFVASEKLPTDTDLSAALATVQSVLKTEATEVAKLDQDHAALAKAQADLAAATPVKAKGQAAPAQPAASPGAINTSALTDAISALKTAQTAGQKAEQNLSSTRALYSQLSLFAANATASIDQAVAAKISQADVAYTSTVASIAPLTTATTTKTGTSAAGAPADKTPPPPPPPSNFLFLTPPKQTALQRAEQAVTDAAAAVASDVKTLNATMEAITSVAANIEDETTKLNNDLANYGLSTAEANVTTCVKSI